MKRRSGYVEVEINECVSVPASEVLDAVSDADLMEEMAERNLAVKSFGEYADELRTRILARDWVGALSTLDRICDSNGPARDMAAAYAKCPKIKDLESPSGMRDADRAN